MSRFFYWPCIKRKFTEPSIEDIGDSECNRFYDTVRGFYETEYIS